MELAAWSNSVRAPGVRSEDVETRSSVMGAREL